MKFILIAWLVLLLCLSTYRYLKRRKELKGLLKTYEGFEKVLRKVINKEGYESLDMKKYPIIEELNKVQPIGDKGLVKKFADQLAKDFKHYGE